MRALRSEQEGVSAIVGLVLVISLALGVGLTTYIRSFVPVEQSDREYNTMRQVEQDFRALKQAISSLEPGQGRAVAVKLGAEPASAYEYVREGADLFVSTARVVDRLSPVVDTFVRESSPNENYWDKDGLFVSPLRNDRMRTYLKFDLRQRFPGWSTGFYNKYDNTYYDKAEIVKANLWLYVWRLNLTDDLFMSDTLYRERKFDQLEIKTPVTVEAVEVENDNAVVESLTWNSRLNSQPGTQLGRAIENQVVAGEGEWVSFDVTAYVRRELKELLDNQLNGRPLSDNYVSFLLREPENSSLRRRVGFVSSNAGGEYYDKKPYLEIVNSRGARVDDPEQGIIESGYIEYRSHNREFPDQNFIYESGALIQQQYNYYDLILPGGEPEELIQVTLAEGNNIRVTVTNYRITNESARTGAPKNIGARWVSGRGWASLGFSIRQVHNIVQAGGAPNTDRVEITIRTSFPRAWRDYLTRLAKRINYQLEGYWSAFGKRAGYDYNRLTFWINGKITEPGVNDIYYTERVVDLDVVLR